ncbi:MAG TPA: YceI family protein [Thermoanaerobaculia bacterium]|nr:YceI family protein [Thermoanaerobaculia bacterium]
MKSSTLFLAVSLLAFGAGCQKSEITDKPAAEITQTTATDVAANATTGTEPPPGAVTSQVIKEKSRIEFVGAKVTRDHQGKFHDFDGWIQYDGTTPSRIAFDIDLGSIETDTADLTKHLKTADFFDVARYPKATFVSTSLTPAPAGSPAGATHMLAGMLDLHGMQRQVTIPVKAQTTGDGVRTTSEFTINRQDWGIAYRGMADDLIKDNVLIKLDLTFPPPPAA